MMLEVDIARILRRRGGLAAETLVDGLAFTLAPGCTLGLVGESGSGKSLTALALIGLLPPALVAEGSVKLGGAELLGLSERVLEDIRGARIGMIFQEPMTALNPAMQIRDQVAEVLIRHKGMSRAAAAAEALRLLDRVRIPAARQRLTSYPHELSGGQRQRVGIAMALAPGPDLLLADEPTTALDVTVQAEILDLLDEIVAETRMALLMISHDMGVIARIADDILVLYAGTAVETGPTPKVLAAPAHPYTRALIGALPRAALRENRPLTGLSGQGPRPGQWPQGCRFAPRCALAIPACRDAVPPWTEVASSNTRCWRAGEAA